MPSGNFEPVTEQTIARLTENAQLLIPENGIQEKFQLAEKQGRPLRIKMGFDPTSPDLHLGHAVAMQQLRLFQELGHLPVIIIGDFTGRIGDPSGKNKSRPLVSPDDLTRNAETYIDQLSKVLDISKIEVHRNSEWLDGMTLSDVITLLSQGTLSQVISRDDFRKRLDEGSPIALHEIIYPFLQGMDSVAIGADIEVGGVDQLYAFQAGRTLQANKGDNPQALVLMPLLRGLDGHKKMSKSLENYIGLTDQPRDMFGKLMSIPDTLIEEYLRLATTFERHEVASMLEEMRNGRSPMDVKVALAHNITAIYHDESMADDAISYFNNQFRGSKENIEYVEVEVPPVSSLIDLIYATGAVPSKSQARRLIEQGAVTIDGNKITSVDFMPESIEGLNMKIGKRNFVKTRLRNE